jgi:tetratricopeptide (TPR) repeat protein
MSCRSPKFGKLLYPLPYHAKAYLLRAEAYGAKGKLDNAVSDFEAALRIDPNFSLARDRLKYVRSIRGY